MTTAVLFCLADHDRFFFAVGFCTLGFFIGWVSREMRP